MLTVTAGHTLDLIEAVLGPVIEVDALTETLWPAVKLTDTGGQSVRETPDHIDVLGKTRWGAVFTADICGGVGPEDARFTFETRGSEGGLSLTGGILTVSRPGSSSWRQTSHFAPPEGAAVSVGLMDAAINVAEVYAHLVRDVHRLPTPHRGLNTHFTTLVSSQL